MKKLILVFILGVLAFQSLGNALDYTFGDYNKVRSITWILFTTLFTLMALTVLNGDEKPRKRIVRRRPIRITRRTTLVRSRV